MVLGSNLIIIILWILWFWAQIWSSSFCGSNGFGLKSVVLLSTSFTSICATFKLFDIQDLEIWLWYNAVVFFLHSIIFYYPLFQDCFQTTRLSKWRYQNQSTEVVWLLAGTEHPKVCTVKFCSINNGLTIHLPLSPYILHEAYFGACF